MNAGTRRFQRIPSPLSQNIFEANFTLKMFIFRRRKNLPSPPLKIKWFLPYILYEHNLDLLRLINMQIALFSSKDILHYISDSYWGEDDLHI